MTSQCDCRQPERDQRYEVADNERLRLREALERVSAIYEDTDSYEDHLAALDAIATVCDEALS